MECEKQATRRASSPKRLSAEEVAELPLSLKGPEVAALLGLSLVRVQTMTRNGTIPGSKVGHCYRYNKAAILKLAGLDS